MLTLGWNPAVGQALRSQQRSAADHRAATSGRVQPPSGSAPRGKGHYTFGRSREK